MKSRRWFVTPELLQWRYMQACGDYAGSFATFPNDPSGIDLLGIKAEVWRNLIRAYTGSQPEGPLGYCDASQFNNS